MKKIPKTSIDQWKKITYVTEIEIKGWANFRLHFQKSVSWVKKQVGMKKSIIGANWNARCLLEIFSAKLDRYVANKKVQPAYGIVLCIWFLPKSKYFYSFSIFVGNNFEIDILLWMWLVHVVWRYGGRKTFLL